MAPSVAALQEALKEATRQLYDADPNTVTVNSVRQRVEEQKRLDKGFFLAGDWKTRSKTVITEFVQTLIADDSPSSSPDPAVEQDSKNGVKRSSSDELCTSPEVKRQRKAASAPKAKTSKPKKESSSSALSELSDSEVEAKTGKKRKTVDKKITGRKQKSASDSELSDLDLSEDEPEPKKKTKKSAASRKRAAAWKPEPDSESGLSDPDSSKDEPKGKAAKTKKSEASRRPKEEESESELSDLGNSEEEPTSIKRSEAKVKKSEDSDDVKPTAPRSKRKQPAAKTKQTAKRAKVESDSEEKPSVENKVDESEADADVKVDGDTLIKGEDLDRDGKPQIKESKPTVDDSDSSLSSVLDEPPPEKRKGKRAKGAPKSKPSTSKELTADEAEIKKLQGHLLKCGVRKIWGFELKKYGTDSKAKIRHLKDMLHDVGMDGRFSEAKARELKEKRELMGELEAVNEMNELWGVEGRGSRASRSKATRKSLKEESSGDEKDDDETKPSVDDDNEDVKIKTHSRVSKRMADLAFLGSDSESE